MTNATTKMRTRTQAALAALLSIALITLGFAALPQAGAVLPSPESPLGKQTYRLHRSDLLAPNTNICATSSDGTTTTDTCDLYARKGTGTSWPGVTGMVNFWSYTSNTTDTVMPTGPTIVVRQGDVVHLELHNMLGMKSATEPFYTSLAVPQVDGLMSDFTGIPDGASKEYGFTAARPGTFIYEAGATADGAREVAMGMVGALVVLPNTLANTAYGTANTAYLGDSVVMLTDVDPAFNADPLNFNMRDYAPTYHLLNGMPYPATTNINVTGGGAFLLRLVNGGVIQHSLGVMGTTQQIVGEGARPYTVPQGANVTVLPGGDTVDMLVTVPSTGGPLFPIYDASSRLDNSTGPASGIVPFGGAVAFLNNGNLPAGDSPGPAVTGLQLASNRIGAATDLAFTATAGTATDATPVSAVEYSLDDPTIPGGSGTLVGGASGIAPVAVSSAVPASALAALGTGQHTLLVRAQNGAGWGPWASVPFTYDVTGPSTYLTLSPSVVNLADVTIAGTANDAASGGGGVVSTTYTITQGATTISSGNALTDTTAGNTYVSVDGKIPSAVIGTLAEGTYTITATSTDDLGNVGPASDPVTLTIDQTAPVVSKVIVTPSPTDGITGIPADPTSVQVTAIVNDPVSGGVASGVIDGEAFLGDGTNATGSGFPMYPYPANNPSQLTGFFPISELTKYADGKTIPVYVHARDAAGNWGTLVAGSITIHRDLIFANNFDGLSSLTPTWSSTVGAGAGLSGGLATVSGTNQAYAVTVNGASLANTDTAYVVDASPNSEVRYNGAFSFDPGGLFTGSSQSDARLLTIFQLRSLAGAQVAAIQYRGFAGSPSNHYQVRYVVGTSSTAWRDLPAGASTLHFTWISGTAATVTFTAGGNAQQNLGNIDTSANVVDLAWLGVSAISGSGTVGSGTLVFDNFASDRVTTP